jgi:predicted PhzF superfamily epimerase YddE/YHI9
MSQTCRYLHLDVFTDRAFGGNQLAVFPQPAGLDTATMQAITREMNYSECTFVFPPEDARTAVRVRIFTPARELPMAGHPTVGTAFALAHEGVIPPGQEEVVFGLGIGPTTVRLRWEDSHRSRGPQRGCRAGGPAEDRRSHSGGMPGQAGRESEDRRSHSGGMPGLQAGRESEDRRSHSGGMPGQAGRESEDRRSHSGETPGLQAGRETRRLAFAEMQQRPPTFGEPVAEIAAVAAALNLEARDVAAARSPVQTVSCGIPFLFVPLATRDAVDRAMVDQAALTRLCRALGIAEEVFIFSTEPGDDGATAYSRMFAPGLGVTEDPATGSASGPLGCYLVRHGLVPPGQAGQIVSVQGVKMQRPSRIHIAIGVQGDTIADVRVGGQAVLVGEGVLRWGG